MSDTIVTEILNRINMEELLREVGKEKVIKLLKEQVRKNKRITLDFQRQVIVIEEKKTEKKRREQEIK